MNPDDDLVTNTTLIALDKAMRAKAEASIPRGHLGMSSIGAEDTRTLWLRFRWCLPEITDPRILRIFRLGNLIELAIIEHLNQIPGVVLHEVDPETGRQFNFSFLGGHFGGSMDGCIQGVPEAPITWHVFEAKSVKGARYKELVKQGVKAWSPEYYGQLQCYMGASGMKRALFVAYNKDTSELYTERVKPEKMYWESAQVKAERIITSPVPPESSYPKREYYKARMMDEQTQAIYWGDQLPLRANCRNCRHAHPVVEGTGALWACALHGDLLIHEKQWKGCAHHNWIPDLVPADMISTGDDWVHYRTRDGADFWNAPTNAGAIGQPVYSSKELAHMSRFGLTKAQLTDDFVQEMRVTFNARVEGFE